MGATTTHLEQELAPSPRLELVSCITPTHARRRFLPRAIQYFLRQDYPHRELVIVDDGPDAVADLIPADPRIRYLRLERKHTIGHKRNIACRAARGSIIIHWDDDDWMADWRIRHQAESLTRHRADLCGLDRVLFYDEHGDRGWEYRYPPHARRWIYGGTLCYTKALWRLNPFVDIHVGEDNRFVWSNVPKTIVPLADNRFYVGTIHSSNTSPKRTGGNRWHPYPAEVLRALMSEDASAGRGQAGAEAVRVATHTRSTTMRVVAKNTDLDLPEFRAFNHGLSLPRMRRWELPFALFEARLCDGMSVLDCTINPVNFREMLLRLYPHTLYRHWSPIQGNGLHLPLGVPDASFDRVLCINTLEHLLEPQREALIAAMARKLKPGGRLVLTSDYYFDSSWRDPAFLAGGFMRADRQEVFNGWNKVTPQEWVDRCKAHDLVPVTDDLEEPREDDPALYRQQAPYPHACIGGVFRRGPDPEPPTGKTIVLALLTWNTHEASLDSVHAHLREARMLQRLGHSPLVCVCDNGSTDGTAEALRALEPELDVPYQLILNPDNRGSSIARNQIIDVMLEQGADYLLFVDGDIEVVPFSSFAMLRYMEAHGRELGCLGANSADHTPYRDRATPYLYSVPGDKVLTTNVVAWTQYGMFRRAMFEDGIRFDESPPFDGSGWGFEDNDLAFQMDVKGYVNHYFAGMVYLHRAIRSSTRVMRRLGIDPQDLYSRRKRYVIDKWSSVPSINSGPLVQVRRVNMVL